jgi:hypothetical protein
MPPTHARQHSQPIEPLESRVFLSNVPPVRVPDDLSAMALNDTSVLLRWTDVAVNEVRYVIARSSAGSRFRDIAVTDIGAESWVDQTVLPETEYTYRIRAGALIGPSANSRPVTVTTLAPEDDPFAQLDLATEVLEIRGTPGDDVLSVTVASGVLSVDLNGEVLDFALEDVGRISILTFEGDDKVTIGTGIGAVNVATGNGNDSILSGAGSDRLDGGAGNDVIRGKAGNDTITGGDGNDTIYGQAGNDFIRGNIGADKLVGGDGADSLFGDRGNDRLYGELGLDSLVGGGGSNFIQPD